MFSIKIKNVENDIRVGLFRGSFYLKIASPAYEKSKKEIEKISEENDIKIFGYGNLVDNFGFYKFFNKYPAEVMAEEFENRYKNLKTEIVED